MSENSQPSELDALLRKAELQQKQLQLELQFQKNMALFQKFALPVYNEYINYTPKELRISLDGDGHLNLINMHNGKPVYQGNPVEFCNRQFEQYSKDPNHFKIGFREPEETYFFQLPMIRKIMRFLGKDMSRYYASMDKPIGVMVVNGCGLGYHLHSLIENAEIYTICIIDPHKDSFYASLHTIDWEPIIRYFYRPGRMLKLFIEQEGEHTITAFRRMTAKIGLHNIANTYVYNHLTSDKTIEFMRILANEFHLTLTGTGFLEDEQVSFAHTIDNLNQDIPVFSQNAQANPDLPPAIIVGNGPSLDGLIDQLKSLSEHAVLFSCGTTTGTLYRHGIVPDFHVEMERIGGTTKRIKNGTDQGFRDQVNLLALNTVAPESMALFPKRYMAKKLNDPGETIIDREFGQPLPYLNLSNPTCTNTGLSFALQMGFREVYLFGVDLGMKDEEKHHASSSQYYDKKDTPLFASSEKNTNIIREGNFGGEVKTTQTMDTSRANMSLMISLYPDARVYNPNDGALIKYATTLHPEELAPSLGKKAEDTVEQLLSTHFSKPPQNTAMDVEQAKKRYLTEFFNLRKHLKLPENLSDILEIQQSLDDVLIAINACKKTNPAVFWMVTGSVQSFFSILMRGCLVADNEQELKENYHFAREIFQDFIQKAYAMMRNEPLKHHDINADFSHLAE